MIWTVKGSIDPSLSMPEELSEYHETTFSYDYETNEVLVYTTRQDVYEGLLARSTRPKRHRSLEPGYELVYKSSVCASPMELVK